MNEAAHSVLDEYLNVTSNLKDKLGAFFLPIHDYFDPKSGKV